MRDHGAGAPGLHPDRRPSPWLRPCNSWRRSRFQNSAAFEEQLQRIAKLVGMDGDGFDLVLLNDAMPGMNALEGIERMRVLEGAARGDPLGHRKPRGRAKGACSRGGRSPAQDAVSQISGKRGASHGDGRTLCAARLHARRGRRSAERDGRDAVATRTRSAGLPYTGEANKEIVRDLEIREPTVKLHVKTPYRKIGAANRTQAAMLAKEAGLV
ncbi:LuxR C-terminal-related transcriptional regulator [Salipiger aestuarii]|nr:LuxR C-terminal-related transcriptional regulator [Salipiger aestuarii]